MILTNLYASPTAPDVTLAADNISFGDPNPTEGDSFTVQATISNTESSTAVNVIAAFFAGDPTEDGFYLGADFLPTIPANGAEAATVDWDTTGWSGDVDLYVVLDPTGRVAETDETNNRASQTIYVTPLADLTVSEVSFDPDEPHLSEWVSATAIIVNMGGAAAPDFVVGFYDGDPEDGGTEVISTTTSVAGSGVVTVTVPWLAGPMGAHQIYAVTDSTDVTTESYEDNNSASGSIFVGMPGEFYSDCGGNDDPAFDAEVGYGYLSGQPLVWGSTVEETARWSSSGNVSYRFDYLIPGVTYHLDLALYDGDGAGRVETVWVDGVDTGQTVDLSGGQVHWVSIRLDPNLYADHSITVDVRTASLAGAVVSEIAVREIEYVYLDSGPNLTLDPPYAAEMGYGYLNGYGSAPWGNTPTETLRTVAESTVEYHFDNLSIGNDYQVNLTFYEGDGAGRQQTVEIDGVASGMSVNLDDGEVHYEVAQVPVTAYLADESITVGIQRTNGNFPVVSGIALEERTVPFFDPADDDSVGPTISTPTYPTSVASNQSAVVRATISDVGRGGPGVSQAWLYQGYSYPFSQQSSAGIGPGGNGDGTWTFTIPAQGSGHEEETLKFLLLALDGDDSPASTTKDANGSYYEISITSSPPEYKAYLPLVFKTAP